MPHLFLVDDHALICDGIKRILPPGFFVAGESSSGAEVISLFSGHNCPPPIDLLVIDYGLPDMSGIEATRQVLKLCPSVRVIMLLSYDDPEIVAAGLAAGVSGFFCKRESTETLLDAITAVAAGHSFLSPLAMHRIMERFRRINGVGQPKSRPGGGPHLSNRELEVLQLVAAGKQGKEIANVLGCLPSTVKHHRKNLMRKLGTRNVAQLISRGVEERLIYDRNGTRD